tara:strand:+ start:902 stop:1705 length:804 start_codon:yes stop_codon:yes gene_type:complete
MIGAMAASPGFFLDSFTGVKGAYSLRRISGSIINVVRVRRDTAGGAGDQDEADFSAAEIESGALASWVGAGFDGFVVKLYDQSPNDNDAAQPTGTAQPTLISAGSLVTSGGLPAWEHATLNNLLIDGISDTAFVDSWYLADTSDTQYLYPGNNASTGDYGFVASDGSSTSNRQSDYGAAVLYADGAAVSDSNRDDIHTALNGRKLVHHQSGDVGDWADFQVGAYGQNANSGAYNYSGKFQLILIWDSDQSSSRAAIDASLNSYYEVY